LCRGAGEAEEDQDRLIEPEDTLVVEATVLGNQLRLGNGRDLVDHDLTRFPCVVAAL
jgi:hypothetical protein